MPDVDDDDVVEVITIRVEDLVEVDETEGLGVVSGTVEDRSAVLSPRTCVYAVPPMPEAVPPPTFERRRPMRWTPERGITSQPEIQIGVMAREHK